MKKLEDFKAEKVSLKNVYGGETVATGTNYINSQGCAVTTVDAFEDKNCDGVQNAGESGWGCTTIKC